MALNVVRAWMSISSVILGGLVFPSPAQSFNESYLVPVLGYFRADGVDPTNQVRGSFVGLRGAGRLTNSLLLIGGYEAGRGDVEGGDGRNAHAELTDAQLGLYQYLFKSRLSRWKLGIEATTMFVKIEGGGDQLLDDRGGRFGLSTMYRVSKGFWFDAGSSYVVMREHEGYDASLGVQGRITERINFVVKGRFVDYGGDSDITTRSGHVGLRYIFK